MMMTLRRFAAKPETVPLITAWYLADLGEARGRQGCSRRIIDEASRTFAALILD